MPILIEPLEKLANSNILLELRAHQATSSLLVGRVGNRFIIGPNEEHHYIPFVFRAEVQPRYPVKLLVLPNDKGIIELDLSDGTHYTIHQSFVTMPNTSPAVIESQYQLVESEDYLQRIRELSGN